MPTIAENTFEITVGEISTEFTVNMASGADVGPNDTISIYHYVWLKAIIMIPVVMIISW